MDNLEYISRYVLCFLAIVVILNCVLSLIRLRPKKKVYALLVDVTNGDEFPITCYETSVGRSKSCDMFFSNITVSRSHAVVALRKDGFYVFDTESKSGVFVNGEQKQVGDVVKMDGLDALTLEFYGDKDATTEIVKSYTIQRIAGAKSTDMSGAFVLEGASISQDPYIQISVDSLENVVKMPYALSADAIVLHITEEGFAELIPAATADGKGFVTADASGIFALVDGAVVPEEDDASDDAASSPEIPLWVWFAIGGIGLLIVAVVVILILVIRKKPETAEVAAEAAADQPAEE